MPRSTDERRIPVPQAIAACMGFAAFTVSVVAGLRSGNPVDVILGRAIVAMLASFAGGFAVGLVVDWMVREEIARIGPVEGDADGFDGSEDLDGLTGVDIVDEGEDGFAGEAVETENRSAAGARREKNAA
ncbi:MAG: hypothetical protein RI967_1799 [Planctomycetota bacterium]|jgi:hypothetical protein